MNNIFLSFLKTELIMAGWEERSEFVRQNKGERRERQRGESSLAEQEQSHAQQSFVNMGEMESGEQRSSYDHYSANHQHHQAGEGWDGNKHEEGKDRQDLRKNISTRYISELPFMRNTIGIGEQDCCKFRVVWEIFNLMKYMA